MTGVDVVLWCSLCLFVYSMLFCIGRLPSCFQPGEIRLVAGRWDFHCRAR